MEITLLVTKALSSLLLLPANLVLLCIVGMLLRRSYPSVGSVIIAVSLLLLLVFSSKFGSLLLVAPLERRAPLLAMGATSGAQAIVILGGGRLSNAPEYNGEDQPNYRTLARLRYAAKIQRQSRLPVLVSGGAPDGARVSEATVMATSLRDDFGVMAKWREEGSDDTAQNAKFSAVILQQAGIKKIILVTDALHTPRAQMMFAQTGLEVVSAPTVFFSHERLTLLSFLPSGEGMRRSASALHEWLGLLWYQVRHGQSQQAAAGPSAAAS